MITLARDSKLSDVWPIADNIRPADLVELRAMRGTDADPSQALMDGYLDSDRPITVVHDGKPAAMFGVVPGIDTEASIWLLGTPDIERCSMCFLRHSRGWLDTISREYELVYNYVHKDNQLHIRWLNWLGFDLLEPEEGDDSPFIYISYLPKGALNNV